MSLPINLKFEVPRHKAPPPTKVPLWPTLTPPPRGKASGEPVDAPGANRPIPNPRLITPSRAETGLQRMKAGTPPRPRPVTF